MEFVEKWMTFSISKFNGAEPTFEYLDAFEKSELKVKENPARAKLSSRNDDFEGKRKLKQHQDSDDDDENDILGAYITVTPKVQKKSKSVFNQTPEVIKSASKLMPSEKSGNVVYSFGSFGTALESRIPLQTSLIVKLAELNDGTKWLDSKVKYLTSAIQTDAAYITDIVAELGREFSHKILTDEGKPEDDQLVLSHCDEVSQNNVRCLGRLMVGEGKKSNSVSFIGFDEMKSRVVDVDLSKLSQGQVFSGQTCIIEGNNPRGRVFYVNQLHCERKLFAPQIPMSLTSSIQIMIASGPFSDADNLMFEYLEQLTTVCVNNKPDLLILTGTFFNKTSKLIYELDEDVEDNFNRILNLLSEKLGKDTKIVVVSSVDDINSSGCYPTHQYKFAKLKNFANIFHAPDPSCIDVAGVKIAISSVDIQQHLSDSEICVNMSADKVRRYVNNILHQKSFYPLFPPEVPTSIEHLHEFASINQTPNILILPSDQKFFIREINGCLCVNPGRLSAASGKLGTYARVLVQPPRDNQKFMMGQIVNL